MGMPWSRVGGFQWYFCDTIHNTRYIQVGISTTMYNINTAQGDTHQIQGAPHTGINKRLLIKPVPQHSMRGLCHGCLTSNVEVSIVCGKILCDKCSSINEESAGNEH